MSKRTRDRLDVLAKLLEPQPDRWVALARKRFPAPLTLEMLDMGHDAYVAKCRADYIADGNVLDIDARAAFGFRSHEEATAVLARSQRELVQAGETQMRDEAVKTVLVSARPGLPLWMSPQIRVAEQAPPEPRPVASAADIAAFATSANNPFNRTTPTQH